MAIASERLRKDQPGGVPGLNDDGHLVGTFIPRRGTAAEIDAQAGKAGELATTSDTHEVRLFDGETNGGHVVGGGEAPHVMVTNFELAPSQTKDIGSVSLEIGSYIIETDISFYPAHADDQLEVSLHDVAVDTEANGVKWMMHSGGVASSVAGAMNLGTPGPLPIFSTVFPIASLDVMPAEYNHFHGRVLLRMLESGTVAIRISGTHGSVDGIYMGVLCSIQKATDATT